MTQIGTETGRRNGGRERGSASDGRTRKDGEGGNTRMGRTHTRSEMRSLEKKKPWRRRRTKIWQTPLTLRGRRSLPERAKRTRVVKESGCGTR